MTSDGTNITGEYSADGTTLDKVGQAAALPANAKIGLFALSNAAATNGHRQVRLRDGHGPNAPVAPARVTTSTARRSTRQVERDRPRGRDQVQRRQRRPERHHRGGRPLHQQRLHRDAELLAADRGSRQVPTTCWRPSSTDQPGGRLRPGRHHRLHRRRQLREARRHLGRQQRRGSTASSCVPRPPRRSGTRSQSSQRPDRDDDDLAASDQGRDLLHGRVLVRRDDLDLDERRGDARADRTEVRPLHARRAGGRRRQRVL